MASLSFKNISKSYDDVSVLHNIDIDINEKELLVLVGPSGCGKSTLLRMVAGLEEISSGDIYIGERIVNNLAPKDRSIAMVFQDYALYPHMSVKDNMSFGLRLRKMNKQDINARVNEAASILQISHLLERKPKALSGGQRQRVAIGRAIVRKPEVFLFDEPLSNLDAKLREEMRVEISRLHQKLESTMIYVTHDQVEAMTLGTRIAVLNKGYLQQVGTPSDIYNNPCNLFVAGFMGSPTMNFINGNIIKNKNGLFFENTLMSLKLDQNTSKKLENFIDKKVVMGTRPDDIEIGDKTSEFEFNAILDVEELLGHKKHLHLKLKDNEILVVIKADFCKPLGSELSVKPDINKIHWFCAETEKRI